MYSTSSATIVTTLSIVMNLAHRGSSCIKRWYTNITWPISFSRRWKQTKTNLCFLRSYNGIFRTLQHLFKLTIRDFIRSLQNHHQLTVQWHQSLYLFRAQKRASEKYFFMNVEKNYYSSNFLSLFFRVFKIRSRASLQREKGRMRPAGRLLYIFGRRNTRKIFSLFQWRRFRL